MLIYDMFWEYDETINNNNLQNIPLNIFIQQDNYKLTLYSV